MSDISGVSIGYVTGPPGIVPIYEVTGLSSNMKIWHGQTTTDASGKWTISFTGTDFPGFASPPKCYVEAISSSNSAANAIVTTQTAPTTSGVSGGAFQAATISLLGLLSLANAGAGVVIKVVAIGS